MIIVGNAVILSKDNFWNSLLNHFQRNDCLYEGSNWKTLTRSTILFNKIEPYYAERAKFQQEMTESISTITNNLSDMQVNDAGNKEFLASFLKKYRASELGFEMLPEQKSKTDW
jgi:regulator of nonsense transcripts 1